MYIHSYQIHNVLDAYRKQLSQGPSAGGPSKPASANTNDKISISAEGQKSKIVDNISSQILDRIAKFGPQSEFDQVLANRLSQIKDDNASLERNEANAIDFTYTEIDELNRKTTSTLQIEKLSPFRHSREPQPAGSLAMDQQTDNVPVNDNDDEKDQLIG